MTTIACPAARGPYSLAEVYGTRPNRRAISNHAAQVSGLDATCRLLEIGCGNGTTAIALARDFGCRVDGIDLDESAIEAARHSLAQAGSPDGVTFATGDVRKLPYPDACFDQVLCESVFSTVMQKEKAAAEMKRVLKPGGRLVMLDFVLLKPIPEQVQQRVSFIPCLSRTLVAGEYLALFEALGFRQPYVEDHSDEVKKAGLWIYYMFGAWQKMFGQMAAIQCCASQEEISAAEMLQAYQDYFREACLGYQLIMVTA
jgi:ubiquinone/menaquinone biosynthesis C-methylase UbiE